jgi:hypothetical protein
LDSRKNGSQGLKEDTEQINVTSQGIDLIPPSDIAWLWHCHRLAPYRYMDYVQATYFQSDISNHVQGSFDVGKMSTDFECYHRERPFIFQSQKTESSNLHNGPENDVEYADSCSYTQVLWKKLYPHESFFLEIPDEHTSYTAQVTLPSFLRYDLDRALLSKYP